MRFARTSAALPAIALFLAVAAAPPAAAATEYQRGPDPTEQSVLSATGPFTYSTVSVSDWASAGFGRGTIYYPNETDQGTFGGVAVSPGYTSTEAHIAWLGSRLASHGFVVITVTTNSLYDDPTERGQQLLAALDHLATKSPTAVRQRLDPDRMGVVGHSMGGGGSLYAVWARPSLKAAVPLAPYHTIKNWSGIRTPTMFIGGSDDTVATVEQHAEVFYNSLVYARDRAYAELAGATHNSSFLFEDHPTVGKFTVAWLKRFIDSDTRYDRFLCPPPSGAYLTEYRSSCPHA
ncbi:MULTISPECIES: alpha/beta hydrolase family protein [Actinokineospora]|uniref:Lipase n=1 Tax=Actinokineospora fastidiosa TaxID=1816 RepID=A0A918LJR6_9PSEU|nr:MULTISPECIES: phosphohydrolase [Actinokineospora]UVS79161.1 Lipase 1 [Actinokineospora sp. UTMC 2448]GGS58359.1 lipase [Actinokineospora fastidiosa]